MSIWEIAAVHSASMYMGESSQCIASKEKDKRKEDDGRSFAEILKEKLG